MTGTATLKPDPAMIAAWDTWQQESAALEKTYGDGCYAHDRQMQYDLVAAVAVAAIEADETVNALSVLIGRLADAIGALCDAFVTESVYFPQEYYPETIAALRSVKDVLASVVPTPTDPAPRDAGSGG